MKPKEKAEQITDAFDLIVNWTDPRENAKECVKQIIKSWVEDGTKLDTSIIEWWKEVLKEFEDLED